MHNNHINLIGDSIIDNFNIARAWKDCARPSDNFDARFDRPIGTCFTTRRNRAASSKELQNGVSVLSMGGNDLLQN